MDKKYLIIIAIIIAIICCSAVISIGLTHEKTYEPYAFSSTCSIELPTWITFNSGAGDMNSNSNVMGSDVEITTKALFGNNEVMQITYSHNTVDGANVGADLNDNTVLEQNGKQVYVRSVMNEETGESVSVMGENEEVVDYIADHVKFNGKNAKVNKTNKTTSATSNSASTNNNNDEDELKDSLDRNGKYRDELEEAYNTGFDDGVYYSSSSDVETTTDDSSSSSGSSSRSGGSSSSSNGPQVETTTG